VDFVVLEQGIDTTNPGGRMMFRFLAALAEYDREMIVEGTLDGLAAARARGRVGGRPDALSPAQLEQAQLLYDNDTHTVDELAAMFRVGRSTLYRQLHAYADGRDCALMIYRNTRTRKVDAGTNRRYGETGAGREVQLEADRKWFRIGEIPADTQLAMASGQTPTLCGYVAYKSMDGTRRSSDEMVSEFDDGHLCARC
jgi:hypothetical protein